LELELVVGEGWAFSLGLGPKPSGGKPITTPAPTDLGVRKSALGSA